MLPYLPLAFPVPSYASGVFAEEAAAWLRAAATCLAPLVWPKGPIVLVQVDNEAALYFRDGVYDQDYHPDAVEAYRRFLRRKYKKPSALCAAYDADVGSFEQIEPPRVLDVESADALAPHLDWAEFQESLVESAVYKFRRALEEGGLDAPPKLHNLPLGEALTPLDPARIGRVVDMVALDLYHRASGRTRRSILRRTTDLALRARAAGVPAFGAELAAGFAFPHPPLTEADNAFGALTALAYGLRGFNVYMAVGRDRWIGGPIDSRGRSRPSADFWQRLLSALERVRFHELSLDLPVRVLVPRCFRRLQRVLHAFGPASAAAFSITGEASARGGLEQRLDFDVPVTLEAEGFLARLEDALDAERIPYALQGLDLLEQALEKGRWIIVLCAGSLEAVHTERLARAVMGSQAVSVGPRMPERNERCRRSTSRIPTPENARVTVHLPTDVPALRATVSRIVAELELPRLAADPVDVHTSLHLDAQGVPRVLFVLNAADREHSASVPAPAAKAVDALSGEAIMRRGAHFVLTVPARTVRMLELTP